MTPLGGIIPLALLGALLGLDVVSFPQAMLSRPLVAATLAGTLVGEPSRGLLIGVVLELFALEMLPFGASRYPEWGSASVVGGAIYGIAADATGSALAISVFAALVTAAVGEWSMSLHRRLIGQKASAMRPELAEGSAGAVTAVQLWGLTSDLVRGGVLSGLSLTLFLPVTRNLQIRSGSELVARAVVVTLAAAVGTAAVWNITRSIKGAPWFFYGGIALGAMLVALT